MCKRKFGQIPRGLRRTQDLPKKNGAREEDNQLWLVGLDAGFRSNTLVRDTRLLRVARVRRQGKGMRKSHRIPLLEWGFTVRMTVWIALNALKTKNWRREWDSIIVNYAIPRHLRNIDRKLF